MSLHTFLFTLVLLMLVTHYTPKLNLMLQGRPQNQVFEG